jgi:F-type H+-transporting ATPase subunit b
MAEENPKDAHVREPGAEAAPAGHVGAPEHHELPTAFGLDAPQWIALAMVVVFAILIWKRVPALIGRALDSKIAAIRAQLDEAAQLRAEAEAIKAEYEAKAAQADTEAATVLERARAEAEGIVRQAESDASALVERRGRIPDPREARRRRRQGPRRPHHRRAGPGQLARNDGQAAPSEPARRRSAGRLFQRNDATTQRRNERGALPHCCE